MDKAWFEIRFTDCEMLAEDVNDFYHRTPSLFLGSRSLLQAARADDG